MSWLRFRLEEEDIVRYRKFYRDSYLKNEMDKDGYLYFIKDTPITFNTYQDSIEWSAARTPTDIQRIDYMALGLAGEAGEVIDEIKKMHRDDKNILTEERKAKIKEEAGDALYYFAGLLKT